MTQSGKNNQVTNVILCLNTLALAGVIWLVASDRPATWNAAMAGPRSSKNVEKVKDSTSKRWSSDGGVSNLGTIDFRQRQDIIDWLQGIDGSIKSLKGYVESGNMKVEVTNLADLADSNAKSK
jgi:hypothetical protein